MTFFVLRDNYDEGLELSEYQTEDEMITDLLEGKREYRDTFTRIDTVIEGEEITSGVLDMLEEKEVVQ